MNFVAVFASLWLLASPLEGWSRPLNPDVRVRLWQKSGELVLTGWELRALPASPGAGVYDATSLRVRRTPGGGWQVRADSQKTWQKVAGTQLSIRGQWMRVGVKAVPDKLDLFVNGNGVDVVATIPMQSYLVGVLPAEMPATWPLEALKAQAVAARSFALRLMQERRDWHYDVEASVLDQAFDFSPTPTRSEEGERILKAVQETRGEVLIEPNRRVVKAYYSADCGCQSEDPKYVWGKSETMESVRDPSCQTRAPIEWNASITRAEIRKKLIAAALIPEGSELRALHVANRTPSGRVHRVAVSYRAGGLSASTELSSQDFRRVMGFARIRSTNFNMTWWGEDLQVSGHGAGHGVGLCQRGAHSLSQQGLGYREILKFYYPKTTLRSPKAS